MTDWFRSHSITPSERGFLADHLDRNKAGGNNTANNTLGYRGGSIGQWWNLVYDVSDPMHCHPDKGMSLFYFDGHVQGHPDLNAPQARAEMGYSIP
jgi:hypothetical protein